MFPHSLFDLSKDPCEQQDLSASNPAMLQQLLTRLEAYSATVVPSTPDPHPNPDGPHCPFVTGSGNRQTQNVCKDPGAGGGEGGRKSHRSTGAV